MSVWQQLDLDKRAEYVRFLQIYGVLSNLFRQKKGDPIPYLDSKFQETVFSYVFKTQTVDVGNTPHDSLAIINQQRIGIGIKTWMNSNASYQKVMQLKKYQNEINQYRNNCEEMAYQISVIKNRRIQQDYARLGLSEENNIYHYVTRDKGKMTINECAYPLVDLNNIQNIVSEKSGLTWSDGLKKYKYTFGDSQIWQYFDPNHQDTFVLEQFDVKIIDDPFSFLLKSYETLLELQQEKETEIIEVYLPLYSYRSKEVELKSGLNAWNAAPKSKHSTTPRPLNEVYIPIPREFHKKHPSFFCPNIFEAERKRNEFMGKVQDRPEVRFHLQLPNGKRIPALVTQDKMKGLQSGSLTERDENGKLYGQSALGEWLLIQVLKLDQRVPVTREWLSKRETDAVRLWRKKDDYRTIYIDFAPLGAFERFMKDDTN